MDLISSGSFSAGGFLAAPAFFPTKAFWHQHSSSLTTTGFLPGTPFLSDLAARDALSPWSLWFLIWQIICFSAWFLHMNLVPTWFSGFSVDSSVWVCDEFSYVVLGGVFGSLSFFQTPLRSVLSILCMGSLQSLLRKATLHQVTCTSSHLWKVLSVQMQ